MSNMSDTPAPGYSVDIAPSQEVIHLGEPDEVKAPAFQLDTIGYRLMTPGGKPFSEHIFSKPLMDLTTGQPFPRQDEVVSRKQAEDVLAELKDEHDERGIDIDILGKQLAEAHRLAAAWQDTAAFHHRNEEFWQGLVRKIGLAVANHDIGVHIADDGTTWNPEPLALKVVESIEKSYAPGNRFQRALRILITGK